MQDFRQSLREDAFIKLLRNVAIGALLFMCFGLIDRNLALMSGIILLTCWLANGVRSRGAYYWAVALFLASAQGLIAATFAIYYLASNPFIFFTPLLVVIAGLLVRPAIGFVVATGAALLLLGATLATGGNAQVWSLPFIVAVSLGYLSAALTWLLAGSFLAAVEWAIDKVERRGA